MGLEYGNKESVGVSPKMIETTVSFSRGSETIVVNLRKIPREKSLVHELGFSWDIVEAWDSAGEPTALSQAERTTARTLADSSEPFPGLTQKHVEDAIEILRGNIPLDRVHPMLRPLVEFSIAQESALREERNLLDQTSALLCDECGWRMKFPGEPCKNCGG